MRTEAEVNRAIEQYSDMVLRLCMVHLKNEADAEDIFQNVFLKYALSSKPFVSAEHEKAWFIRVTINGCRDLLKSFFHSHVTSLEECTPCAPQSDESRYAVLEALWSLPKKYRDILYLHYYEGYTCPEIAKILRKNPNTVYTHLHRAKEMLKDLLGGDPVGQ